MNNKTIGFAALAAAALAALGVVHAQTQETHTQTASTQTAAAQNSWTLLNDHDRLSMQIWNLSEEEMLRAKVLLQGPRKAFSVENISPIEALGIHARTDAERRKYAEKFAKAFHDDVQRSLAWQAAYDDAMARLFPHEPVFKWSGEPLKNVHPGAAKILHIPNRMLADDEPQVLGVKPAASAAASAKAAAGSSRNSRSSIFDALSLLGMAKSSPAAAATKNTPASAPTAGGEQ